MTSASASHQGRCLSLHLQTALQFQVVMNAGVLAQSPHFAMHTLQLANAGANEPLFSGASLWMGVVLPKRHAKKAVRRNLIKRQIYDLGRLQSAQLDQCAHVIRLKRGFDPQGFISASSDLLKKAVRAELSDLMSRGAARLNRPC